MARVLPVPAPARISTGPSVVSAARRCSGFSSSRRVNIFSARSVVECTRNVSRRSGVAQTEEKLLRIFYFFAVGNFFHGHSLQAVIPSVARELLFFFCYRPPERLRSMSK